MENNKNNDKAGVGGGLPEGWVVKPLGELGTFSKGKGILKDQVQSKGLPCIRYGEIYTTHDFIISAFKSFISQEVANESKEIKQGDILFAGSGETVDEIGKAVAYLGDEKAYAGGDVIILSTKKEVNTECLSYALETDMAKRQKRVMGQGNSVVHIYPSDLVKLKIALPPYPEQTAIAHVLGLMDKAIQLNNQIVAQKELRKKWLMQQLLTGKKRVKGFGGAWKEVRLGDAFEFIKTYSISRDGLTKQGGGSSIYCIHYGDIHAFYQNAFLDFDTQESIPQIIDSNQAINERDYLKEGDVIMADASEDYDGVGEIVEVVNLGEKVAVGGLHTIVLRGDSKVTANKFRGYLFTSEIVRNTLRKMATGSSVYSVTKTTLSNLTLVIPDSLSEQTAIAQILQAADKELGLLRAKGERLREQKKGVMGVLLTGRKRLKIE
jgi:type I restriction enzyme S subunit